MNLSGVSSSSTRVYRLFLDNKKFFNCIHFIGLFLLPIFIKKFKETLKTKAYKQLRARLVKNGIGIMDRHIRNGVLFYCYKTAFYLICALLPCIIRAGVVKRLLRK